MPKGREEKFTQHRSTSDGSVTLIRKDSPAGRDLKREKELFTKAANSPTSIFGGSSAKFKQSTIDNVSNNAVVHDVKARAKITKTQVTPGAWKTKSGL